MESLTRATYAVFGGFALLAGAVVYLWPSALTGEDAPPQVSHLLREEAACFIFIGLMFLWCLRHFAERRPVHLALLGFTALFAGIHWVDYFQDFRHVWSPVVNSVPPIVLLLTAPTRQRRATNV